MQGTEKEKMTEEVFQDFPKVIGEKAEEPESPGVAEENKLVKDVPQAIKEKTVGRSLRNCSEIIEEEKAVGEQKFSKRQLLTSEKFSEKRDILTALLSEDRDYSVSEAENIIQNFMKGKVN